MKPKFGELCLEFKWVPLYDSSDNGISLDLAKEIGDDLGVDWNQVDINQFAYGIYIEKEHGTKFGRSNITNDELHLSALIALAHLAEGKHYYTYLKEMEEKMEKFDTKPSHIFLADKETL